MSRPMRIIQRILLLFGALALLCSGGSLLYGIVNQKLDSWRFDGMTTEPFVATSEIREGDIVGRLEIPDMKLSVMVLQGVGDEVLDIGAGHVPGTSIPGTPNAGNVAIAAHRDTFFRDLRGIRTGSLIRLTTLAGTFEYSVSGTEVVQPEDTAVLQSHGFSELTLITCYPFSFIGPAPQRFVVHARATGMTPWEFVESGNQARGGVHQ